MTTTLILHCHADGKRHDVSKFLIQKSMQKSMQGASDGAWNVVIKVAPWDVDDTGTNMIDLLLGMVRYDDWAYLDIGGVKMVGLVSDCRESSQVQGAGAKVRTFALNGPDWSRCMSGTEIRMLAILSSAVQTYEIMPEPFVDESAQQTVAIITAKKAVGFARRIPGLIDERDWGSIKDAILGSRVFGSDLLPHPLPHPEQSEVIVNRVNTPAANDAAGALGILLSSVLRGLWVDPAGVPILSKLASKLRDKKGKVILDRHGNPMYVWPKVKKIEGYAWRLAQVVAIGVLNPDSVMREHLNEAFVEIFYEYLDDGATGAAAWKPAVIVRPKPFDNWSSLPRTMVEAKVVVARDLTRSGAEAFNYWMPNAPFVHTPGAVILWDSEGGKLPIVDAGNVAKHGLRPAEPVDSMWPPSLKQKEIACLEWHRTRMARFRRWYYHNAEYLTGTVTLKGTYPTLRIGTVLRFPYDARFRVGGKMMTADTVEGYVTGVSVQEQTAGNGATVQSTTAQLTRVQPVGGLAVPGVSPWKIEEVRY